MAALLSVTNAGIVVVCYCRQGCACLAHAGRTLVASLAPGSQAQAAAQAHLHTRCQSGR